MSWTRIFIHLVFSTRNRIPYLHTPELRETVFRHIKQNAKAKNILLDAVNGYKEHVHCLLALEKDQSVSQVTQLIKGESSYWINKNNLTNDSFYWQDDYWAMSVGDDQIKLLREYILAQEEHHRRKSFSEEIEEVLKKYSFIQG